MMMMMMMMMIVKKIGRLEEVEKHRPQAKLNQSAHLLRVYQPSN
jgi:hypothetical protein